MGNYDEYFKDLSDEAVVNLITQKLQKAGNRSERRKILKSLTDTKEITKYAQKKITANANKEIYDRSNDSFCYILSMFGIVLHDKYSWKDEEIENIFTEVSRRLNDGCVTIEALSEELYKKTGIELKVR